jgi:hypothetical protein
MRHHALSYLFCWRPGGIQTRGFVVATATELNEWLDPNDSENGEPGAEMTDRPLCPSTCILSMTPIRNFVLDKQSLGLTLE